MKDREIEPYAFVIGVAVFLSGENVLKGCSVYDNAGIGFGAWNTSSNNIYRCRVENCGFLEAMGTGMLLYGVASHNGNIKASGDWKRQIDQFQKGYYLRAHMDQKFVQKHMRELAQLELAAYLPKLGIRGKPAHQQILLEEFPFKLDMENVGTAQKWYDPAHRLKEVQKKWIGRHWPVDHVHDDLGPGWHFTTFALPPEHKDKQAFPHFGSVDGDTQVHLNGKLLGRHDGTTPRAGPNRSTSICRSSSRPAGTTWRSGLRPARARSASTRPSASS